MHLASIHVYPVKACRGLDLEVATLAARGLEHDRRFMVVDSNGFFVTQRGDARLALVSTAIEGDTLRLSSAGTGDAIVPLEPEGGTLLPVRVWRDVVDAIEVPEGSRFFRDHLGADVKLVYMPDGTRRAVDPTRARDNDIVSFADGYPLLAISEASLADLNARLAAPIPMKRFRPNLVFGGTAPYAEDAMKELRIGTVTFRGLKRCDRCVVTTIDPETGTAGHEPLRTLATYRREDGKVWFGMNLVHDGEGTLRTGDRLDVLATHTVS